MEEVNVAIIGAGVVGLAIAEALSSKFDNIVVLERNDTFGQEISSRNSEVIHSGIYYPEGSLKAKLCVEGARLLYEICGKNSVPYRKFGKLIIAADQSEIRPLEKLFDKGLRNNSDDIRFIDKSDIRKFEPNAKGVAAIYSPDTGVVDSHALMKYFFSAAKSRGALFMFQSEADSIKKEGAGWAVGLKRDGYKFKSRVVINCAGLFSGHIASLAGVDIDKNRYRLKLCKGSYFSYSKDSPVKMLVYPMPNDELTGLGIHATLNMAGRLRFGPDVEYVDTIDYNVDAGKKSLFYRGASRIISGLVEEALGPDQAGVRPKLYGHGEAVRDFVINEETKNSLRGLINLIGIESPGLTASPAIAEMVCGMVSGLLN